MFMKKKPHKLAKQFNIGVSRLTRVIASPALDSSCKRYTRMAIAHLRHKKKQITTLENLIRKNWTKILLWI